MNNASMNIPMNLNANGIDAQKQVNNYSNSLKSKGASEDDFKNALNKAIASDSKKTNDSNKSDKQAEETKWTEASVYSKPNETNKLEENEVESLNQEAVSEAENINFCKDELSNELSNDLMLLLQQLLQGKISFEEFVTKASQGNDEIEKLSMELTGITLDVIKQNFQLSSSELENLKGKLSSDLTQLFQKMLLESGQEDKSFETIISKISETISKALEEDQINSFDINKSSVISLQEQIINNIKSKLEGNSTDNETYDLNSLLNNSEAESLQDSLINKSENTSNGSKDFSKEGNSEEKFLKELASGNKNDITTKVDKLVNFMNGFNKSINTNNINEVQQAVTVSKETFVNDIIKSVKFMQQNDMKEMTVKIMPRELGEIVIKLTMENGLMKANITANNKEAYNLLNSNIQDISNKLGNEQIKIQNFTVDIYNGDTNFLNRENGREQNKQSNNRNNGKSNVSGVGNEKEELSNNSIVEESNVNAFV